MASSPRVMWLYWIRSLPDPSLSYTAVTKCNCISDRSPVAKVNLMPGLSAYRFASIVSG